MGMIWLAPDVVGMIMSPMSNSKSCSVGSVTSGGASVTGGSIGSVGGEVSSVSEGDCPVSSVPVTGGSVSTGISGAAAKAVEMLPKSSTMVSTRQTACIQRCFIRSVLSKKLHIKSPDLCSQGNMPIFEKLNRRHRTKAGCP